MPTIHPASNEPARTRAARWPQSVTAAVASAFFALASVASIACGDAEFITDVGPTTDDDEAPGDVVKPLPGDTDDTDDTDGLDGGAGSDDGTDPGTTGTGPGGDDDDDSQTGATDTDGATSGDTGGDTETDTLPTPVIPDPPADTAGDIDPRCAAFGPGDPVICGEPCTDTCGCKPCQDDVTFTESFCAARPDALADDLADTPPGQKTAPIALWVCLSGCYIVTDCTAGTSCAEVTQAGRSFAQCAQPPASTSGPPRTP